VPPVTSTDASLQFTDPSLRIALTPYLRVVWWL